MAIDALPIPPQRSDPSNFAVRGDAFLAALPAFALQAEAARVEIAANQESVAENTETASSARAAAEISASQAAASATASVWVSGAFYAVGAAARSELTYLSYIRTVAGAGALDPSVDSSNWAAVVAPIAAGGTGATSPTAARAALQAAKAGANNDITSLNGLMTPLSKAQGGSGTVFGEFPAGTRMPFAQATAPTGWTQDTSDAANNRMLRVVNSAGNGVGGSHSPVLNNVVPSHTHGFTTGTESADHAHGDSGHSHYYTSPAQRANNAAGSIPDYITTAGANTNTGYASLGGRTVAHTHSGSTDNGSSQTNWQPRYIDLIICSKN